MGLFMIYLVGSVLGVAIAITEIVIGSVYLQDCPLQRFIPIYLVVTGAFTLPMVLLSSKTSLEKPVDQIAICFVTHSSLVSSFLFCWFIAGNVWIYSIYEPNYNSTAGLYCDKTLYEFSFWITTLEYIMTGVGIVFGCCC